MVVRAQFAHRVRMFLQFAIAGLDRQREARIGFGVFVAAADARVRRQHREFRERGVHLRRRAFEQAPAAEAEQGVAAEQQAFAEVSDVAAGMAWHGDGLEGPRPDFDAFAVRDPAAGPGDAFVPWREHLGMRPAFQQGGCAGDVIRVVVGEQDRDQVEVAGGGQHRCGFARIDDQRPAGRVRQQPDVVVLQGG